MLFRQKNAGRETQGNMMKMSTEKCVNNVDKHGQTKCVSYQEDDADVAVENEASVAAHAARVPGSGLTCCCLCLRLFPSDAILLSHFHTCHQLTSCHNQDELAHDVKSSVTWQNYTKEQRKKSCLVHPVYPPSQLPILLDTPLPLDMCSDSNDSGRQRVHRQDIQQRPLHKHSYATNASPLPAKCSLYHYKELMCHLCSVRFSDTSQMATHLQICHGQLLHSQPYHQSSTAGRMIKPQQNMVCSINNQHSSLLSNCLLCSKCNTVFSDRSSLLCHTLKVHPELNQFNICKLCDRLFDNNLDLHRHLKKAHGLNHSGTLKCPFCPAWLPSVEMASVHRVTLHTGALPVHCPFCGTGW
ncbi:Zinc finger protein 729 [Plakobranchus ocellatus]|uniref:Zinc finger protein 729 n=1 Tax=Plakobranchus ocellatus TaxID=259542 RepID=A0AAV3Y612_9GAST|nr:Zinc finger protein 729 [Plakobranchus ocellatus]